MFILSYMLISSFIFSILFIIYNHLEHSHSHLNFSTHPTTLIEAFYGIQFSVISVIILPNNPSTHSGNSGTKHSTLKIRLMEWSKNYGEKRSSRKICEENKNVENIAWFTRFSHSSSLNNKHVSGGAFLNFSSST